VVRKAAKLTTRNEYQEYFLWYIRLPNLPPEMSTRNISCDAKSQPVRRADKLTTRNEYQEYFLWCGKAAGA